MVGRESFRFERERLHPARASPDVTLTSANSTRDRALPSARPRYLHAQRSGAACSLRAEPCGPRLPMSRLPGSLARTGRCRRGAGSAIAVYAVARSCVEVEALHGDLPQAEVNCVLVAVPAPGGAGPRRSPVWSSFAAHRLRLRCADLKPDPWWTGGTIAEGRPGIGRPASDSTHPFEALKESTT